MKRFAFSRPLHRCFLAILAAGCVAVVEGGQEPTPTPPDAPAPVKAETPAPTIAATPAATPMPTPEAITFFAGAPSRPAASAGLPGDVAVAKPVQASPISAAVAVPAGQALLMTSGTVPPVLDEKAPAGSPERYGDTKTQGIGALRQIEAQLKKAGLGLQDVIYLRVYVAADKTKEGKFDFPGWFEAYGQFFNTAGNPVRPARSTVGVAALVNPDWLIEIEAVAAYPNKGGSATAK